MLRFHRLMIWFGFISCYNCAKSGVSDNNQKEGANLGKESEKNEVKEKNRADSSRCRLIDNSLWTRVVVLVGGETPY